MIEIIDNVLQLTVTSVCAVWASVIAITRKSQQYFILACFYITFALGLLFWLLYLVFMTYTPKIFYVSDLSWIASFLFLLMLNLSLLTPQEHKYRPIRAWIVSTIFLIATIFLLFFGDFFISLMWCGMITVSSYFSTRGILYARKQQGSARKLQYIYIAVLVVAVLEFTLWILSCYFKSSDISNPYFWCDFLLSAGLFALMPAMKKAVPK
ncbi:MAG: histidine kinase [Oscillospiraceae bacterium]